MSKTHLKLILYIIILIGCSSLGTYLVFNQINYLWLIPILCGIAIAIWSLFTLYAKGNKKIAYFLNAVRNSDTTLTYPETSGTESEKILHQSLNRLNGILKEARFAAEAKEQYFQTIINESTTGIIIRRSDTKISLANKSVLKLCKLPVLYHINQLKRVSERLKTIIETIKPNQQILESITIEGQKQQLSVQASELELRNEKVTLISIRNLQIEMDQNEIESWIKLIRVLTHEIMNSLAPITSISQTLADIFDQDTIDESAHDMAKRGLAMINEQSIGLTNFVHNYRSLTRIPEPKFTEINTNELLEKWKEIGQGLASDNLTINLKNETDIHEIHTDVQMLTRVVTNLMKNAIEAMHETNRPYISLEIQEGNRLQIINNGPKIEDEILENIWVPFFTTKESGSGIGLSLCKQIIKKINGQIQAKTSDKETIFEIKLN